ncbi:MAG TPA: hypothetical protein VL357_11945 [Rariglobus sp.]|jgi:hypothetical protein|nr:hypothetical protein [Rariglobus sp.]
MHRIPADYVSLFLRTLKWDAEARGITFQAALKEAAQARITATSEGLALVGTATDGSSVNYALPSPAAGMSLSPETLALMLGRIWDWVDEILAATPDITDNALLSALRARNQPVRLFRPSFYWQIR